MITNALQIQGWMSERELRWLAETAKTAYYIAESGCFLGRSTTALADNTLGLVFAIDPYEGDYKYDDGRVFRQFDDETLKEFRHNLKHHIESGKVIQVRSTLPQMTFPEELDFVFLDGDHREQPLEEDILTALAWTRRGGIISGHDYTHTDWPSVKKVVDKFFPEVNLVESIWWIRKS